MTERHLRDTLLSADLQASTSHHPTTATIYTDPPTTHHGHFLPTNPMPYMAPSATHQPELLLLHWMLCTITTLVDDLQHHPIVQDPTPPMSSFINTPAYRLYLQLRNTLRHFINTTHEAQRGLNILQFLPGSPGSPGHYRMDPTVTVTPGQTNYLSDMNTSNTTATTPPTGTPPLLRQLHRRGRSRSRERLPLTTPSHPNLTAHPRQPTNNTAPAADGHRGHLHRALWTASTSSAADRSAAGSTSSLP